MKYVIGIDGGNTKTDYFLFDIEGNFIDRINDGTCSHEAIGFEKAEEIIKNNVTTLLNRNNLTFNDIEAGAFGLAGIDNHIQQIQMSDLLRRVGFTRFEADNDGYLGLFAGTSKGYGICSINGTGTVAAGVDPQGRRLQVGGIGPLVGDDAGGSYIARMAIRAVYDSFYRCGEPTIMAKPVFEIFEIDRPLQLMLAIGDFGYGKQNMTKLTRLVFQSANQGDKPALDILKESAKQLAKTAAGCARNLAFDKDIDIVLAGSVWVKAESPALFNYFKEYMKEFLPNKDLNYNTLKEPPATGAVLWALSLCGVDCFSPAIKQKVVTAVRENIS